MVSDGGGRSIPAGIVGLHTLYLLLSSLVAHDHATEDNHTTYREGTERPTNTTEHNWWVQCISLDRGVDQFNDCGGRGCNHFVPVLVGNGTRIASTGDIFDQLPGQM